MRKAKFVRYDDFNDAYIYALEDGRYINLSGREVRDHGPGPLLESIGYAVASDGKRLSVKQHGRVVGTLPADFEPTLIRSRSFLYDPRPGDFARKGDEWIAADSIGPGDFEAVPGFAVARPHPKGETP